ncbi:MAG TPA: TetR/AcrR family transcriptional regulator [Candidatus Limnocylindrales bacterium]|nr:TetR/AcrR family transcriptional regulator [Candidatus Limnocylindrales bacterium]
MTRPEWTSNEPYARRRELYLRAAPVLRAHGYRSSTLKALAHACGLSIPALYRYFPSKKALALFPLVALYPELHAPPPDVSTENPGAVLAGWIEAAVAEAPNYVLAARLLREAGVTDAEKQRMDAALADHIVLLGDLAVRAAPHLTETRARELGATMINLALGPALTGIEPMPGALRRELRALLRGHGVPLP